MTLPIEDDYLGLCSAPQISGAHERMRALGVPASLLGDGPRLTADAVRIRVEGPLFVFDAQGVGAVIVVEGSHDGGLDWEEIDDLVAFRTANPNQWWRLRGEARWLGQDAIDRGAARWPDDEPPLIVRTPLDWLKAGGANCAAPLVSEAIADLLSLSAFTVPDRAFGLEIAKDLKARALAALPEIGVEIEARRVAA